LFEKPLSMAKISGRSFMPGAAAGFILREEKI